MPETQEENKQEESTEEKDKVATISSWRSLEEFGIFYLTSEGCALNLRGVVDLSRNGIKIIREVFRFPDVQFRSNMNSGYADNLHVACMMMPKSMYHELAVMSLFIGNTDRNISPCDVVMQIGPELYKGYRYMYADESEIREIIESYDLLKTKEFGKVNRNHDYFKYWTLGNPSGQPRQGFSNVHSFTERYI
jgi:hypothetical protein